ncbi:MAG: DUF1552 domain-containing protein [Polyangiales bacterium]
MTSPLSRRTLLRGLGGVAVGLPFLGAMLRPGRSVAQPSAIPKRLIVVYRGNGVVPERWFASGGETDFTLGSSMAPLARHRDDLVIFDGLDMTSAVERPGGGNGHDVGTGHCCTATAIVQGPSGVGEFGHLWDGSAGGASFDQVAARHFEGVTPYSSLAFGIGAEGIRQAIPSRPFWRAPFEPVIPMHSASQAFDRVFAPLASSVAEQAARAARRRRVLDATSGDLTRLRGRVGADDRRRLDAHAESIADIARRLDELPGACAAPTRDDRTAYEVLGRLQMDLATRALACDLTRVVTLQYSTGQSGTRFRWLDHADGHHGLSHEGDSNTTAVNQLAEIDTWYAGELAYLLDQLAAVEEGDGSRLLDHTAVLLVNEIGKGNTHTRRRMPFLLAGSAGGAWRTGRNLQLGGRPHGDLFVSILRALGLDVTSFGDPDFCNGPLAGL